MLKKKTKTIKKKSTKKEKLLEFKDRFSQLYNKKHDYMSSPKVEELIGSAGCDVIASTYIGSWSGDVLMVLKNGTGFGLLIVGYGSCSGCDALKSCNTFEELFDFREKLFKSIMWKEYSEFIEYLKNKDWETEFYCSDKKNLKIVKEFIKESKSKVLMAQLSGI